MTIIKYKNIFFSLAALFMAASIAAPLILGVNMGLDFTGGALVEVSGSTAVDPVEVAASLRQAGFEVSSVRGAGETGITVRAQVFEEAEKASLEETLLSIVPESELVRSTLIGPTIGDALTSKAYRAIAVVVLCIVLFISFAFRKVSKPVSSWKYGMATIVSLVHNIIVCFGAYVVLGYITGAEIDLLFVSAILAILGYSVHDTIVVFDRVRERGMQNNERGTREDFGITVGTSLHATLGRSLNTSLTLALTLLALVIFGGQATFNFAMLLLVGTIVGTYSSLCLAAPLLVVFANTKKA